MLLLFIHECKIFFFFNNIFTHDKIKKRINFEVTRQKLSVTKLKIEFDISFTLLTFLIGKDLTDI